MLRELKRVRERKICSQPEPIGEGFGGVEPTPPTRDAKSLILNATNGKAKAKIVVVPIEVARVANKTAIPGLIIQTGSGTPP